MIELLLEKKEVSSLSESLDPNVDGLIVKIMTDKLNDKYGNTLNESQKDIIRSYVFSMSDDGGTSILKKLNGLKGTTLLELKQFRDKTDNSVLLEKIDRVEKKLSEYLVSDINDDQISKFLTISKLKSELEEALSEK